MNVPNTVITAPECTCRSKIKRAVQKFALYLCAAEVHETRNADRSVVNCQKLTTALKQEVCWNENIAAIAHHGTRLACTIDASTADEHLWQPFPYPEC